MRRGADWDEDDPISKEFAVSAYAGNIRARLDATIVRILRLADKAQLDRYAALGRELAAEDRLCQSLDPTGIKREAFRRVYGRRPSHIELGELPELKVIRRPQVDEPAPLPASANSEQGKSLLAPRVRR